jgi:predicted RecB family nuclease
LHILSVIRHEGRTFETTPKTFAVHDEEEFRDILLAHLNGHYQGDATGETFRRRGKTDIRIEDNNRAAFVATSQIRKGQKKLSQAIEQLLGYLIWRDCKAPIAVVNKHNAKFSGILEAVPGVFRCIRWLDVCEVP